MRHRRIIRKRRRYYNSGCLVLILAGALMFVVSCDYLQPNVEKSKTEKRQWAAMQEQNKILERIAVAIEECNYEFKD